MIDVFSFKKDKIQKIKIEKLSKGKSWIRAVNPDHEEIKKLSKYTEIPLEELQESFEEDERPRITTEKYIEIIYRAPYLENDEITTLPLYIYIYKNRLITIEKKPNHVLTNIKESMDNNKFKFLFRKGYGYFIFFILDKINDEFLLNIDKIAANIDVYEEVTKRDLTRKDLEKIYEQSVTLSFFNQALIANIEVLNSLKKGYFIHFKEKDKELFEELYFDALQVLDTEKIQREAITNLFNLQSAISSSKLNEFIKKLTSIALIIAIPTLISGMFGMNFLNIPLRSHPYGFYITSFFILLISIFVFLYFRKSYWV
jgi:magnesium transporter